jgi:nitrate reductase NapD
MTMLCDRRDVIRGRWQGGSAEIASILVQARPERLADAERAIAALGGTEIHGRDPRGKLVVVIESEDVGALGTMLNIIAALPDVLSATLVFHATDAG